MRPTRPRAPPRSRWCPNVSRARRSAAIRRRPWAVRAAIGATPARLGRQSLLESLLLSAGGAVLALWVARATIALVRSGMPGSITRFIPGWSAIGLDGVVVGYALLLTVGTG